MADIFISYKREDRRVAERLSIAFEQLGYDVWWDFELLSGDKYRQVIRTVIDQCKAAVVLWSERSVLSDFVMDEASHAHGQGKLCPARIDGVAIPFGFGQTHTNDLADWNGELSHQGFQALVRAVENRVGRAATIGGRQETQQSQAAMAELEAFKATQLAGNASALRAFLKKFPHGMFAAFVRNQLEHLEPTRVLQTAGAGGIATSGGAHVPAGGGAGESQARSTRAPKKILTSVLICAVVLSLVSAGGGLIFYYGGGWEQMQLRERSAWAAPLAGMWAPEGLGCEFAAELHVSGDVLTLGDTPQRIDRLTTDGEVVARAEDAAYAYRLDDGLLIIRDLGDTNNREQKMTPCTSGR